MGQEVEVGAGEVLGYRFYWVFCRKGKAGQGNWLRTGPPASFWQPLGSTGGARGLVTAPGAALAWRMRIR